MGSHFEHVLSALVCCPGDPCLHVQIYAKSMIRIGFPTLKSCQFGCSPRSPPLNPLRTPDSSMKGSHAFTNWAGWNPMPCRSVFFFPAVWPKCFKTSIVSAACTVSFLSRHSPLHSTKTCCLFSPIPNTSCGQTGIVWSSTARFQVLFHHRLGKSKGILAIVSLRRALMISSGCQDLQGSPKNVMLRSELGEPSDVFVACWWKNAGPPKSPKICRWWFLLGKLPAFRIQVVKPHAKKDDPKIRKKGRLYGRDDFGLSRLTLAYPLVNIQKTMENHHFLWEN